MATLEQLSAALIKADAAGNAKDAKALADAIRQMQAAPVAKQNVDQFGIPGQTLRPVSIESPLTLREKITGVIETPAALAAFVALPTAGLLAALAGATDKTPAPKAATATSAMRLKIVLLDISFLSLVVNKTFSFTAGKDEVLAL